MHPEPDNQFLLGILEGFYGRTWSFATREAYAGYLASAGLNTCLYCPKADPYLRRQWHSDWPAEQWQELRRLSAIYREQGVNWGVGLSPFALYRDYSLAQRQALRRKIGRLAQLETPLLAVLFDDMPGDLDALAQRQAEIVADVVDWLPGVRIMVCPTYYSFDPVLEKVFGAMPKDYWPELGSALSPDVDVFWTGNHVCADTISRADIQRIRDLLGRRVLLWDNYPVNDGAKRSNFLYLQPLSGREPLPPELASGHLCNLMNQGLLSLPALSGLAHLYQTGGGDEDWLPELLGAAVWERLQADRDAFGQLGLSGLGEQQCRELAARYRALPGPAAAEVTGWLCGEYHFDPACLTD